MSYPPPRDPTTPVRLPGDRAYALYADQMANGLRLHSEVVKRLRPCFDRLSIPPPVARM